MTAIAINPSEVYTNGAGVVFTSPKAMLDHYRAVKNRIDPRKPNIVRLPQTVVDSVPPKTLLPRQKRLSIKDLIEKYGAQNQAYRLCLHKSFELPGKELVSVHSIIENVADKYGVSIALIKGHNRVQKNVIARHAAMYAVATLKPDLSLPRIGRYFRRDHTTILNAIRAHAKRNGLPAPWRKQKP